MNAEWIYKNFDSTCSINLDSTCKTSMEGFILQEHNKYVYDNNDHIFNHKGNN